jgi:hypothetical protein
MKSSSIIKVFYDPRNDMDALCNKFNIIVNNIICLQLCHLAYRRYKERRLTRYVFGLTKTIQCYIESNHKKEIAMNIRDDAKHILDPKFGDNYHQFAIRPLDLKLIEYCIVDVFYFDQLLEKFYVPLGNNIKRKVLKYSQKRLVEYKKPGYDPISAKKVQAPIF